jgi:hypothetical protein
MLRLAIASFSVVLAATACGNGPRDATPLPEPPSMDLSKVGPPEAEVVSTSLHVSIRGEPGAAPGGALVRVTALDGFEPPHVFMAEEDGSFAATDVPGSYGGEFRFQVESAGVRGVPRDAFYLDPLNEAAYLVPSLRHTCLALSPGFEVTFAEMALASLALENGCDEPVSVSNARSRSGAVESRTSTALPLLIEPGEGATLSLEFQGSAFGSSEDTLFIDVTVAEQTIRYPITLFAP